MGRPTHRRRYWPVRKYTGQILFYCDHCHVGALRNHFWRYICTVMGVLTAEVGQKYKLNWFEFVLPHHIGNRKSGVPWIAFETSNERSVFSHRPVPPPVCWPTHSTNFSLCTLTCVRGRSMSNRSFPKMPIAPPPVDNVAHAIVYTSI